MPDKFMFFSNFRQIAKGLPDDLRLQFYDAMCDYVFEQNESDNPIIKSLITAIKPSLEKHQNWGGARDGAGRPKKNQDEKLEKQKNQDEILNIQDFQDFKKLETETEDIKKKTEQKKKVDNLLNNMLFSKNQLVISDSFVIPVDEEPFSMYAKELGTDIIKQVERWLIKNKNGVAVDKQFICKQFMNFAQRQGINILDIVKNGKNSQK